MGLCQSRLSDDEEPAEPSDVALPLAALPLAALPDAAVQGLSALLDPVARCRLRLVCRALKAAADRQLETVAIDCSGLSGLGPADVPHLLERHPRAARLRVLCTEPKGDAMPPGLSVQELLAFFVTNQKKGSRSAAARGMAAALRGLTQSGATWPGVAEAVFEPGQSGDAALVGPLIAPLCGGLLPALATLRVASECPAAPALAAAAAAAPTLRALELPCVTFPGQEDAAAAAVRLASAELGKLSRLERLAWGTDVYGQGQALADCLEAALPSLRALTRLAIVSDRASRVAASGACAPDAPRDRNLTASYVFRPRPARHPQSLKRRSLPRRAHSPAPSRPACCRDATLPFRRLLPAASSAARGGRGPRHAESPGGVRASHQPHPLGGGQVSGPFSPRP
jgi:hypothetical protein